MLRTRLFGSLLLGSLLLGSLLLGSLLLGSLLLAPPLCAAVPARARPGDPGALPASLRLPDGVRPTRCALDLTIDPVRESFEGTADLDLQIRTATDVVWLHAVNLTIREAVLEADGVRQPARVFPGADEKLGFRVDHRVGPGKAHLRVRYTGQASRTEAAGVFCRKVGEQYYAVTQFEPTDARRGFPCFDEPSFKIPWQVTLRVPRGDRAVSNTPELSTIETPDARDGMKTIRFAETRPLPSYLVAFAVGPFDVVDLGKVGRRGTPVRIWTARGKGKQTGFAVKALPALLVRLEEYFGQPYPYPKPDHLAVPISSGFFGAMENAGLITYDEPILVAPPEQETIAFQRGAARVAAHEMAHQWFGDFVTTAWWDDLWGSLPSSGSGTVTASAGRSSGPCWEWRPTSVTARSTTATWRPRGRAMTRKTGGCCSGIWACSGYPSLRVPAWRWRWRTRSRRATQSHRFWRCCETI